MIDLQLNGAVHMCIWVIFKMIQLDDILKSYCVGKIIRFNIKLGKWVKLTIVILIKKLSSKSYNNGDT